METSVDVPLCSVCYSAANYQGVNPISHQRIKCLTSTINTNPGNYFLVNNYNSLTIHDSNKTLKVRRQSIVIVIIQHKLMAYRFYCLDKLCLRVPHEWRNAYTGPGEIMLCAKPKVFATVGGEPSWADILGDDCDT